MRNVLKKMLATIISTILVMVSGSTVLTFAYDGLTADAKASDAAATTYKVYDRYNFVQQGGSLYYYNGQTIWDYAIGSYNNFSEDRYCLMGGLSVNGDGSDGHNYGLYNSTNDFSAVSVYYKVNNKYLFRSNKGLTREQSKNALLWLYKNMFTVSSSNGIAGNSSGHSTEKYERDLMRNHLNEIIKQFGGATYKNETISSLGDGCIEVIQQFVIWNFVNSMNDSYYYRGENTDFIDNIQWSSSSTATRKNLTDTQKKQAKALYTSLRNAAISYAKGTTKYTMPEIKADDAKVTVTTTNAKITKVENTEKTYRLGPITVAITNKNNVASIKDEISSNQVLKNTVKYVDANGNEIGNNITDIVNKGVSYYIQFERKTELAETATSTIGYKVKTISKPGITNFSAKLYTKSNTNRQPIISLNKDVNEYEYTDSVTFKHTAEINFDLALTKEIAQIYRYNSKTQKYELIKDCENTPNACRLTKIDPAEISKSGTAIYRMDKRPITVLTGDIVRYKLTVYNEGNIVGYVREITDYLPEGLEIVEPNEVNNEYSSKNAANKNNNILTYSKDTTTNQTTVKLTYGSANEKEIVAYNESEGKISSFSDYIECKVTSNTQNKLLTNVAEITNYGHKFHGGYEQAKDGVDIDSEQDNVFKEENISKISEYEKMIESRESNFKNIMNIDKGEIVKEDDEDFEQIKVGTFDLALRKYITSITSGAEGTITEPEISREPVIDENSVQEFKNNGTTAGYYHTKAPLTVQKGDKVLYTIRIYNEGYIDGYAKKITDYLPDGLEYIENSDINKKYGWTATKNSDDNTTVVTTEVLKDTPIKAAGGVNGYDTYVHSGGNYNGFWTDIQIECEVVDLKNGKANTNKILTNVAEITNYGYEEVISDATGTVEEIKYVEANEEKVDIDSEENNVSDKISDEGIDTASTKLTQGYYKYQGEIEGHSIKNFEEINYKGVQDDDDFENVQIKQFDLALRKYITKVNDTDLEVSREPDITTYASSYRALAYYGTAYYYHSKTPVEVKEGDKVLYTIRIYNEGFIDGIVQEITDYLPEGLEFIDPEESEINKLNGWTMESYENGITTIKTDRLAEEVIVPSNGYSRYKTYYTYKNEGKEYPEELCFWKDVQVECKVTSIINDTVLTNVAEITNYGYNNDEGEYIEANVENVDQDSQEDNVFKKNTKITNNAEYYQYKYGNLAQSRTFYQGVQDDDDFEDLIVKASYPYELVLRKTDEDGNEINGARFTIVEEGITEDADEGEETSEAKPSIILENEEIDGEKVIKQDIKKINKDFIYKVTENESAVGYENLLGTNKLQISAYFDEDLNLNLGACESEEYKEYYDKYGFVILDDENVLIEDTQTNLYDKVTVNVESNLENIPQIVIEVTNKRVTGKFDLELVKLDQKDGKTPLPETEFDITVKKDDEVIDLYDTEGNSINTKGLMTDQYGKISLSDIKISEEAEYTFEIVETKAPEGYIKLESPITLKFKTKLDESGYITTEHDLEGYADSEFSSNRIVITVRNGQFDLALRKFITAVRTGVETEDESKLEVSDRIPVFKVDEDGNYVYEHTKEPVTVGNKNIVEYTLRVYNEGSVAGYANLIKDDIPEGLEFLPDDELNKTYGWIMLDEEGNETKDVNKAKYITTDYLSYEKDVEGENLINAFNMESYKEGKITGPDWREVKVAFKVTMPNTDDRIIINQAQISDDSDENGKDITDKDSTPDKWIEGEDDQDIEKIKVQYFDLALRKWVTKAIVIEDGKETVSQTGHTAEDDPEEIVKVDLAESKLGNVVVKFEYQIRVTNEGEIPGYVKEISDYIPEGLKFVQADNPLWQETEGKVTTDELKDTLLNPGESAEVTITLTWINREDNMGLKVNVAEISKDYNIYGSPDIDSVPNNQVPGEDDIDDAPVMLTVKTGQVIFYIGVVIAVLAILGTGIVGIKKYVLK